MDNKELEVPTVAEVAPEVVDEQMLVENPELKEAGVEVGSPIEMVDGPEVDALVDALEQAEA